MRYARESVPGIAIRTTMLVGFPGETEEEFAEMCDFVREMRFERLGVFQYSHEEDTSAHLLEDDVPAEVKVQRANALMEIQMAISLELNEAKVGQEVRVLIDRKDQDYYIARTEFDSPDVDNEVLIPTKDVYLRVGDMVNVKIIGATEYDLEAEVIL
jgi:ribosomal protein S12 methylthiotransferase